MEAARPFEDELRHRLRAELDAIDVRPRRLERRAAPRSGYFWIARPLAVALIATLALGALAAAVTRSPDPARWVQPAVWERAFGHAPAPASELPPPQAPQVVEEQPESPAPVATEQQPSRETEPADPQNLRGQSGAAEPVAPAARDT